MKTYLAAWLAVLSGFLALALACGSSGSKAAATATMRGNGGGGDDDSAANDDVWTDPSTGLMWDLSAETAEFGCENLQAAIEYCIQSKKAGYSGWRAPTIDDLRTVIVACSPTETGGACDVTDSCNSATNCRNSACSGCGESGAAGAYSKNGNWQNVSCSSTTDADEPASFVWTVDFHDASIQYYGANGGTVLQLSCVRNSTATDVRK
jgi:hypothetical protein